MNKHLGDDFDTFLNEQGINSKVTSEAYKRSIKHKIQTIENLYKEIRWYKIALGCLSLLAATTLILYVWAERGVL